MAKVIPVLRIYDYSKTLAFYVEWLGFTIDWEHRFEQGLPVFIQVSRDDVVFRLSEHHGDGSPNARITIEEFSGLRTWHRELIAKQYKYNRPGLENYEWLPNAICMTVIDPVGNQLIFIEQEA